MHDLRGMVHCRDVRVRFGDTIALDGLTLQAPTGAITALLGPNGAGKTTFVRCVATLQRFAAEICTVAGFDPRRSPHEVRRRIGLAGQHAAVVDRLTGRENLTLVARLYGQSRRQARQSVDRVIQALSLGSFADQSAGTCSGGQRRRLDLAASLVVRPELLLLDEPTTGVDPRSRAELWQLIRELPGRGTSVLLATQYLEEADALADHLVILDRGRAIASGTPEQLRRSMGTTSLTVEAAEPIPAAAARTLEVRLGAESQIEQSVITVVGAFSFDAAAQAVTSLGFSPTEVVYRPPTLDEVFLALTAPPMQDSP